MAGRGSEFRVGPAPASCHHAHFRCQPRRCRRLFTCWAQGGQSGDSHCSRCAALLSLHVDIGGACRGGRFIYSAVGGVDGRCHLVAAPAQCIDSTVCGAAHGAAFHLVRGGRAAGFYALPTALGAIRGVCRRSDGRRVVGAAADVGSGTVQGKWCPAALAGRGAGGMYFSRYLGRAAEALAGSSGLAGAGIPRGSGARAACGGTRESGGWVCGTRVHPRRAPPDPGSVVVALPGLAVCPQYRGYGVPARRHSPLHRVAGAVDDRPGVGSLGAGRRAGPRVQEAFSVTAARLVVLSGRPQHGVHPVAAGNGLRAPQLPAGNADLPVAGVVRGRSDSQQFQGRCLVPGGGSAGGAGGAVVPAGAELVGRVAAGPEQPCQPSAVLALQLFLRKRNAAALSTRRVAGFGRTRASGGALVVSSLF